LLSSSYVCVRFDDVQLYWRRAAAACRLPKFDLQAWLWSVIFRSRDHPIFLSIVRRLPEHVCVLLTLAIF